MHLIKTLPSPSINLSRISKNDFSQQRKGKRMNDLQRSERWYNDQKDTKYFSPSIIYVEKLDWITKSTYTWWT